MFEFEHVNTVHHGCFSRIPTLSSICFSLLTSHLSLFCWCQLVRIILLWSTTGSRSASRLLFHTDISTDTCTKHRLVCVVMWELDCGTLTLSFGFGHSSSCIYAYLRMSTWVVCSGSIRFTTACLRWWITSWWWLRWSIKQQDGKWMWFLCLFVLGSLFLSLFLANIYVL